MFFFSKWAQESSKIIIIRILMNEWINICEIVLSYFFFFFEITLPEVTL